MRTLLCCLHVGFKDRKKAYALAIPIAVGFTLFFLAFLPPAIYSIDGNSMLAVAESLVVNHDVSVPAGLGSVGSDGRTYSNWYPLLSFLSAPLAAVAHVFSQTLHLPFHNVAAMFAPIIQVPLTAVTAALVALLALELGATDRGAWLAALTFCLGTVALVYVRTFFAEPLLAFLVTSSLYLAFRSADRSILGCSLASALAVLAKPTGIVIGPILSAYLLAKREVPRWKALLPFGGSVMGFLVYAAYNQARFGRPLQFGQPWIFSASSLPSGVAGLLLSPGWGLIWYCPVIILAVWGFRLALRSKPLEAVAIVAIFAAFLGLHSSYENWSGGWSWGPRYLVPAIPGLCTFTGLLEGRARKVLIALTLTGFLMNAPTLFSFYERHFAEMLERNLLPGNSMTWSVAEAPLLHSWPAAIHEVKDASKHDVRDLFSERDEQLVGLWWWMLPAAHISRWIGIAVSMILVCAGVFVLVTFRPAPANEKVKKLMEKCVT
jgi:hypothetical protein